MCDQYRDPEDDSCFDEGNGEQNFNNEAGSRNPTYPDSEAEDESTHCTDSRYTCSQSSFVEDALFWTENAVDNPLDSFCVPISGPEHHTNPLMDLGFYDQLPQLEGNPFLSENIEDVPYEVNAVESPRFGENINATHFPDFSSHGQHLHLKSNPFLTEGISGDELYGSGAEVEPRFEENRDAPYFTDFSASNLTPQFGDGAAFSGGASGQFPRRYTTETVDDTIYDPGHSLHADMMLQSAFGPEKSHYDQDASQSRDDHNDTCPVPSQSYESPPQPRMKRAGQPWTKDDNEKLLAWSEAKVPHAKIGEELGRTEDSCRSHLRDVRRKMRAQDDKEVKDAVWAPEYVPILNKKDTGLLDWETPGLKNWVHTRIETIRKLQNGGPWVVAWDIVTEDLNKANGIALERKDYESHLSW